MVVSEIVLYAKPTANVALLRTFLAGFLHGSHSCLKASMNPISITFIIEWDENFEITHSAI